MSQAHVASHPTPHPSESTPAAPKAPWRLRLLGRGELLGPDGPVRLDRNHLTTLAFLVRGAPTTRAELAGMLWPSVPAATALANLRQMLRRLRLACGGQELVQQPERSGPLSLAPCVAVDLWELRDAAAGLRPAGELLAGCGEVLAGLVLDGLTDTTGWLDALRVEAEGRVRLLCERELRRQQEAGALDAALQVAELWVRAEPTSEPAARALMQLHASLGNRNAALGAYERLKRALASTLEATPALETVALAQRIRKSAGPRPLAVDAAAPLPAALLRPERLVGREAEWAALQTAWQAQQTVFLSGAPGVGKTRLAVDFAAARGECLRVSCQRGERRVAFASAMRLLRQVRTERPGTRLPGWVSRALVRLTRLPEGSTPAPTLDTYEALAAGFRAATRGLAALVVDGLEHCDDASLAFLEYLLGEAPPPGAGEPVRLLACWSPGPFAAPVGALAARLAADGRGRELRVRPLSREASLALLSSLQLPEASGPAAEAAWRYAGGNPFLLLQTLREHALHGAPAAGAPFLLASAPAPLQARLGERFAALSAESLWRLREALDGGGALAGAALQGLLTALADEGLVGPGGRAHGVLRQVLAGACAARPLGAAPVMPEAPAPRAAAARELLPAAAAAAARRGGSGPGSAPRLQLAV